MPQDLVLRCGTDVATYTFTGTAAQVRASIVRICKRLGISTDGTPAEVGTRLLTHIVDNMQRNAEGQSIAEYEAAQKATNIVQAKVDNPL